jgi:hypothetical protein
MKIEAKKQLKIKLQESDADNFKSAIKKIVDESKIIGFKKTNLNEDEIKVIHELSDKLNYND